MDRGTRSALPEGNNDGDGEGEGSREEAGTSKGRLRFGRRMARVAGSPRRDRYGCISTSHVK